jgi:hypothetical protein
MEVLFHFIFELIKISILGCIYATLTIVTFKIIGHYKPDSWFDRVSKKKLRLWFLSGLFISIGLFFFMFTYFGDHGLGDSARVPVGHWRAIQEVNGTQAYIQDEGPVRMIEIDKFVITDDFVYGLTGDANENYDGKFFVYDLANNIVKTFEQEKDYTDFLIKINLDTRPEYKDFSYYYRKYWGGWRFWFLP